MKTEKVSYRRSTCRGCDSSKVDKIMELGNMPLAGGFLTQEQISDELKIPLNLYFCSDCGLLQILEIIQPQILFEQYCYVSSVIKSLSQHFKEYSVFLKENYLPQNQETLLVEFGANDGVLLQYLQAEKIRAIGIEPSVNVSRIAQQRGFEVYNRYFNRETAYFLNQKAGKADVVTGSNVFAHIDDIHEIIKAAKELLKPDGVMIVEVHYLGDLIKIFQYDTIYHEHLCYYSVTALKNIFRLHGFKIIDVKHLPMHGGAIRVVCANENSTKHQLTDTVQHFIDAEKNITLKNLYQFAQKAQKHRIELKEFLEKLKQKGANIVGYGAAGRGTILLNYADIGNNLIDYIVDVSPLRAGKLMPGKHIPIYSPDKARKNPPDYFFVIAWNYVHSIMQQEKQLVAKGVKFIVPFPEIHVI